MSIPATYHTHTTFSDGKNTPEEMILEALRLGMTEIGFSDHSYTPFDRSYCMKKERQTEYIDEIRRLSEKYRGRIRVLLGIEQDSCSEKPCGAYDYVIGSCHYLSFDAKDFAGVGPLPSGAAFLQNGRIYVPVDEGADVLKAAACALFGGDLYPLIEKYYETVGNIVEETECDLIGHFDLITKYNEDGRLFDEEDPRYRAIWQKAADRLLKTGKAFEINTRQVMRGLKSCPYPSPEIITYLAERGAHFVLSGDNHEKETLLGGFSDKLMRISGTFPAVETRPIGVILGGNPYPGRGIIIGETPDGTYAAAAYFIMGRSENSRNRVLEENEEGVETAPFDETKVSDPSLIIYPAVRRGENRLVVTNGDQTETILKGFKEGKEMTESLLSRTYEPDPPNFTPRISGVLTFSDGKITYEMEILKKAAAGDECFRRTFSYEGEKGVGRLIHTYETNGDPLPSFTGTPRRVAIPDDIDEFAEDIWNALDSGNRIALYVLYRNIATNEEKSVLINRHTKAEE